MAAYRGQVFQSDARIKRPTPRYVPALNSITNLKVRITTEAARPSVNGPPSTPAGSITQGRDGRDQEGPRYERQISGGQQETEPDRAKQAPISRPTQRARDFGQQGHADSREGKQPLFSGCASSP